MMICFLIIWFSRWIFLICFNYLIKELNHWIVLIGLFSGFQIDSWLISMADQHPTLARTESIGTSHEGRDMKVIRVIKTSG